MTFFMRYLAIIILVFLTGGGAKAQVIFDNNVGDGNYHRY